MKLALLSGLAALALVGAAYAQDAAAPAPAIEDAPVPPPVKPYVAECLPEAAPAGARCGVVGIATLAGEAGSDMSWQLYDIATRGKHSGLSVLLDHGRVIDKTVVPADQLELWAHDPFVMASVVNRDGVNYAVVAVPGDEKPSALSVHRLDPGGWTDVDTSGISAAAREKLTQVAGAQCYPITSDMSWHAFSLRYGMMSDSGTCGTAFLSLGVENNSLVITDAVAVKPDLTPAPRRRYSRRHY